MADYTVVPLEKTTVMKFVNIRGTQTLTAQESDTQFIVYDEAAAAADRAAENPQLLYSKLANIRNNSDTAEPQAAEMTAVIATFKASARFIANTAKLTAAVDARRLEWGAYLRDNRFSVSKTVGDAYFMQLAIAAQTPPQITTMKQLVWDNFLVCVIENNNSALCDDFAAVLRCLHYESLPLSVDWWRITHSSVVLPDAIFPLKKIEIAESNISGGKQAKTESEASSSDLQNELLLLHTAKQEIALWQSNEAENRLLETEMQAEAGDEKAKQPVKSATSERITDPKAIGEVAGKVLDMLKLPKNPRVELVLQRINKREEELFAQVFKDFTAEKKTVIYAGSAWARVANPSNNNAENAQKSNAKEAAIPVNSTIETNKLVCFVRPLGVADFHRVEQELCRYVPGEVSYIENILDGEKKVRTTRSLLRSENTYTYSRETEKEDIRDTQTTDRFEMEKEASSMISESLSLSANLTVMAKYGEVASVSASAGFTSNTAHEQSNRDVVRSSKEVTEHVRQRMVERVKEERITKILKEFEETNTHSLEATNGNTVGVFRWLDKVYLATLRNYGKRMTFEFNIPEPAAFHLWAMTGADNGLGAMALTEPIHPKDVTSLLGIYDANTPFATNNPLKPLVTFEDITEINYKYWAAAYGVTAEVPPEKKLSITRTLLRKDFTGGSGLRAKNTSVSRIEGYHLVQLVVTSDAENNFQFFVNGIGFEINDGYDSNRNITFPTTTPPTTTVYNLLAPKSTSPDDQEAIALGCRCYLGFNDDFILQVIFIYERSEKMLNDWKIKTFKAIMDAYENKLAAYKNALEEAKAVSRNERHMGTNPLMNEQIIRSELKKLCIYSFVHKAFFADDQNSTWDTENVTDMSFWNIWDGADGFPMYNLSCDERDKFRRERMRFLEDAFDWDLLVSEFLPYYYAYGKTAHWKQLYQLTDTDPLFLNFLQAGLARVRVPVKVGMEAAALRFWETEGQEIPRGNEVYHFANDFLQHLYADIQAPIKDVVVHDAHAEGDVPQDLNSWTIRVPTTLTILQKESEGVDQNNLLCSCARTVPALPMPWIETGSVH